MDEDEEKKRRGNGEALRAWREKNRGMARAKKLDPDEKARRNPHSLRLAVNAKCWDCIGGNADPGPRQRIRDCDITSCSLHPVRPYQDLKKGADEGDDEQDDESAPGEEE